MKDYNYSTIINYQYFPFSASKAQVHELWWSLPESLPESLPLLERAACPSLQVIMKGTKVQTFGARAVAGTWCMAGCMLGP